MPAFNLATDIYGLILTYFILYASLLFLSLFIYFGQTSNNNIPNFLVGNIFIPLSIRYLYFYTLFYISIIYIYTIFK